MEYDTSKASNSAPVEIEDHPDRPEEGAPTTTGSATDREILESRLPLPAKDGICITQRDGDFLLIDADRPSWVVLNHSAMEIVGAAWEGKTVGQTAQEMAAAYQLPDRILEEELLRFARSWEKNPFRLHEKTHCRPELIASLYVEITNGCQQSCSHCFCALAEGDHDRVTMSPQDLARLVADPTRFAPKTRVVLTGGEPTLHPQVLEMLDIAKGAGGTVELHTNGQLDDPGFWEQAMAKADAIRLSLDGANAHTHDTLRGAGTFEKAHRTLEQLQAHDYPGIQIAFTPATINLTEMPQMVRLAKRLGTSLLYINELVPTNAVWEAGLFYTDQQFAEQIGSLESNYSRLVQWISGTKEMKSFRLRYYTYRDICHQLMSHNFRAENCGLGSNILYVTANGDTYPCWATQTPDMKLGNALGESLDAVHDRGLELSRRLSVSNLEGCSECNYRLFCRGGCPARSLHLLGKAEALDPSHEWLLSAFEESAWKSEGQR